MLVLIFSLIYVSRLPLNDILIHVMFQVRIQRPVETPLPPVRDPESDSGAGPAEQDELLEDTAAQHSAWL